VILVSMRNFPYTCRDSGQWCQGKQRFIYHGF